MGDPPRKLVKRLMRATVKPGAPVSYLAHYSMNLSTDQSREAFMRKVAASDGRVLAMRVLVVYCHPVPESFCAAVRDAAVGGAQAQRLRGAADRPLRRTLRSGDAGRRAPQLQRCARPPIPALEPHIEQLKWAEAILFVYPTWWYGLPAMLKGWFDRVWAKDIAFALQRTAAGSRR